MDNSLNRQHVMYWRSEQLRKSAFEVRRVALTDAVEWNADGGRIVHESGGFFSVTGLRYRRFGPDDIWLEQPFILQPEIGILGFLCDQVGEKKRLLVQAKTEPGNPGGVQLAPTFQCTESNYSCRHGGRRAPFFEFFSDSGASRILADSKQSEQGTRFYDKYNRNVMAAVGEREIDLRGDDLSAWRWMPVADACRMITDDFLFNTDARSVLATCAWEALCDHGLPFERWSRRDGFGRSLWESYGDRPGDVRTSAILDWLERERNASSVEASLTPLDSMDGWTSDSGGVTAKGHSSVAVHYYAVSALDREVPVWSQPLVTSARPGIIPLFAQCRDGCLRFLVQVVHEPGFPEGGQISVPFQRYPGLADSTPDEACLALLGQSRRLIDCRMSEEGGRFFHEWNRYLLSLIPEVAEPQVPDQCEWLSLGEINAVKSIPGVFTNEFRSALSLLLHWL